MKMEKCIGGLESKRSALSVPHIPAIIASNVVIGDSTDEIVRPTEHLCLLQKLPGLLVLLALQMLEGGAKKNHKKIRRFFCDFF